MGTIHTDLQPNGGGSLSIYRSVTVQSTGANIKASSAILTGGIVGNNGSVVAYVKLYDKATAPSSGDTPILTIPVPAGGTVCFGIPFGLSTASGLGIRASTGVADNDASDPGANVMLANLWYV